MKTIQFAMLSTVILLLTGCEPTVESLAKNDDKRKKILAECADMGWAAKDDELCQKAVKAQSEALKQSTKDLF